MSTVTPLLSSAAFLVWTASSLAAVGGWCALALRDGCRMREATLRDAPPPFVV